MLRRPRHHMIWPGFILLLLLGLSACGQKGPLYLPDDEEKQSSLTAPAENA